MWTEDADRERAEPGEDYVIRSRKFVHRDIYVYPARPDAGPLYNRFRNTWFLRRRLKPYVPCPESTPMPNSKMTSEQRSKIFSVYLRAWTLCEEDATVEVPFITHLTLTSSQRSRRRQIKPNSLDLQEETSFRAGWKDYIQRVPPSSFHQTRNFMMAIIAEGRNFDRDDTLADAKVRGCPVPYPLKLEEIGHDQRKLL